MVREGRYFVGDTETTGLAFDKSRQGHRLVEIGLVEMEGWMPTGRTFHKYINPGRPVDPEAFGVHGLSDEFLSDKPRFRQIVDEFDEFIGDDPLIFHNAPFDMSFINGERELLGRKPLRNEIVDSIQTARKRFPGGKQNLDALCRKLGVDNSHRELHGALLDASLLSDVWVRLNDLHMLDVSASDEGEDALDRPIVVHHVERRPRALRAPLAPTAAETSLHTAFVQRALKSPLWSVNA